VHAVAALGTTEVTVAGYEPKDVRQPHHAFGVLVAGHPRDTWWSVEASVSGEWPVAPVTYIQADGDERHEVEVDGPRLRADVGLKARFGSSLIPTAYAGIELQAHLRDIESARAGDDEPTGDMPFASVLALGMGLEYRAGDLLLGLDLHIRQGLPADYRSVAALLSVGCFLDQGE
jgi:hypothetical protein